MNIDSIKKEDNILIGREELKLIIKAGKTPSFAEAVKLIAEHEKKPEENIFVESIKGKFGRESFLVKAYIYKSKEDKEKNHPIKAKKDAKQLQKAG